MRMSRSVPHISSTCLEVNYIPHILSMNPFDANRNKSRLLLKRKQHYTTKRKVKKFINDKQNSKHSIRIASYNVNGTSLTKLHELSEWLEHNNIQVAFLSEVKKRAGTHFDRLKIDGYAHYEDLRQEEQGGVAVYLSNNIKASVKKWEGLAAQDQSELNSERIWIQLNHTSKLAICGIYMRCSTGFSSEAHSKNESLLQLIRWEADHLRREGYKIAMLGDFNSHGGDSPNLGFIENPHRMNSNGDLLNDFLNDQPMTVLNNRSWYSRAGDKVTAKGCFTFRRFREDGIQQSVIDYAIVDKSIQQDVVAFEVSNDSYVDSDHNPILMDLTYKLKHSSQNSLRKIEKVNWSAFTEKMKILSEEMENYEQLSIESKSRFLQSTIIKAMNKVSKVKILTNTKSKKIDMKMQELIEKQRKLSSLLRQNDRHKRSREEFIELFKEYRRVRNAIAIRHTRMENETKLRKSIEAKGPGARNFWTYLKQEDKSLPLLPAVQMEDGSISEKIEDRTNALNDHLRTKFRTSDQAVNWSSLNTPIKMEPGPKTLSIDSSLKLVEVITRKEVVECLKSTKTNSAPGPDK